MKRISGQKNQNIQIKNRHGCFDFFAIYFLKIYLIPNGKKIRSGPAITTDVAIRITRT